MNLYIIRRRPDRYIVDAFAYAIVAAETGEAARHTHPAKVVVWQDHAWTMAGKDYGFELWAHPLRVHARLLGLAASGTKAGTLCTSFN